MTDSNDKNAFQRLFGGGCLNYNFLRKHLCHSDKISHYTDLNGFMSIINDSGLWLSDASMLNDYHEIKDGLSIVEQAINTTKLKKLSPAGKEIIDLLESKFNNYSFPKTYICCFSESADSLDLWRTYSKDKVGISIEFDLTIQTNNSHIHGIEPGLYKVVYNNETKSKLVHHKIATCIKEYTADVKNGISKIHTAKIIVDIPLMSSLSSYLYSFKNESFSSEREVRIVHTENEKSINRFDKLYFRATNWGIIPYYKSNELVIYENNPECPDERKRIIPKFLPISKITIGPTEYYEDVKRSIDFFLKNKGYENIPIVKSQVPFRK